MNHIELNAILYYADYLSLRERLLTVTDTCKYFFIHGAPINAAYVADVEPEYDEKDPYFIWAKSEYEVIKNKYGDEGVDSFIDDICSIKAAGFVGADQMLLCIYLYSTKKERKNAFNRYYKWKEEQETKYTHITFNEYGDPQEQLCTKYFAHAEKRLTQSELYKGAEIYGQSTEREAY